ncbi:GNAT family N-acetyltransferase [Calidifontibacter sp. DB0510]|uniref:GNAT family N-acetyltransferase n=1 Tax=Metallococcus carri TaxID=1656884 RepID=A0A967B2S4_9MICO|nr:GNAT family protein [Metallococcus carri]NHN57248.1 GNAT family N-acetyltransferase [Metallococcus carri]NOP37949.1 GNAT family N-acetyltransferase [Calidifontibacter sp. DB2511S]
MSERRNDHGQPIGPPLPGWTERSSPCPDVLKGTSVRLEALDARHVPSLFAHTCGPGTEARWTYMSAGPFADEAGFAAHLRPMQAAGTWPLAIVDAGSGDALGMACYLRINTRDGAAEVGSIMYGESLARTRGATEAMYLMARHLFDDLGYRRYEWKCDALNAPSQAAALRLGFRPEGVWRNAVVYKGRSRDTAWFAMTDEDWRTLAPAYGQWLRETEGDVPQRNSLISLIEAARS